MGTCKADCDWCGDMDCDEKENCQTCSLDCGECEILPEEKITEVKEIVEKQKSEIIKRNRNIILGTAGAIILFIIFWFIYKRKDEKGKKKKKTERYVCNKCKKNLDKKTKFCPKCGNKLK